MLPFVDYGALDRRREFCREEVRLNRRLAPSIYLGVRAIAARDAQLVLADEDDEQAVEYAVEMRRCNDGWTLAARTQVEALVAGDLDELGARLAAFHNEATRMDPARAELEQLARSIQDTFESLRRWPDTVTPSRLVAGRRFVDSYLAGHRTKIEERVLADRVRAGHGDLRAEHVVFTPHGIEIVDCVEFDPARRRVDVAADLAFLVMDLTALGAPRAAAQLVEAYRATGGDPGDDDFLAFHAAGRAWTRGKVALFRSETEDSDRAAAAELQARRLVSLAERFAWRARLPLLLIVCGPPASEKSYLAAALAEASRLELVSSDPTPQPTTRGFPLWEGVRNGCPNRVAVGICASMSQGNAEEELEVVAGTPEARREQAVRSVKKRRDFQTHLVAYLVINVVVWGIWAAVGATSGAWFPWPVFVTLGWGIGIAMNAWDVYFRRPVSEEDIRRELDRLDNRMP